MSDIQQTQRIVVVTGASSGIGAALVAEVAKRGAHVVLAARRAPQMEEVARRAGGEHLVVVTDVTRRADHERLAKSALDRFGRIDTWVNNAGRAISRHVLDLSDDDVDAMVRDNLKSVLYGMQVAVPYFKGVRRGHLVNVSTMLARVPFAPIRSAYCAAKAAMGSLTEIVRTELAQGYPDIRVTTVFPGVVNTDFGLNALGGGPDSRTLPGAQTVEMVATAIADAIDARRGGDVYTRPDGIERVVGHLRGLAGAG